MNLDDFIRQFNLHSIDYDHVYGSQCVDLAKLWLSHLGYEVSGAWGHAKVWDRHGSRPDMEWIPNTLSGVPQKGDLVVWGMEPYGHIAIFVEGTSGSFNSFDQNWGGKQAHIQGHYYNNVIGWLHPKGNDMAGKLYNNSVGQVWMSFDNKKFYVEDPKSIAGLPIINGNAPGVVMIKQTDSQTLLEQQKAMLEAGCKTKIATLVDEITECNKEIGSLEKLLEDEADAHSICHTEKEKLQKKIDSHTCKVTELTAWEHFKMFIIKIFK